MNHKENYESIYAFKKQSDIEIAMDLVSKYYLIKDSILIRFQRKAKETLIQEAKDAIHTITHPVARKLITVVIKK